jgi:predicted enzyme related to lactoylglutathione lyase
MSGRDGYQPGVPCWVDTLQPDPERARRFYGALFGWSVEHRMPAGSPGSYRVCRLHGRDVAGVGTGPSGEVGADWTTYIRVESVDEAVAKAVEAGGGVAREPSESFDGGRAALLSDPAGAVFGVWRPGTHRGAQLVNEPGAWAMSILNTPDVEGAKRFYGALFCWDTQTFDAGGGGLTMWRLPGYLGGEPEQPVPRDVVAVMAPLPDEGAARWDVNFWVHDADAVTAKADQLGGKVLVAPSDREGFREAVLADPAALSVSQLIPGSRALS